MALSAVSGVIVASGVVLLPTAVDLLAMRVLVPPRIEDRRISLKFGWIVSMLPAFGAAYLTGGIPRFNPSTVIKVCLYVAYKALIFVKVVKTGEAETVHPSIQRLGSGCSELFTQLIIPVENPQQIPLEQIALQKKEEVRQKWQNRDTLQRANALIELAAQDLRDLFAELKYATSWEPAGERNRKMAELLTNQKPPRYYRRFCSRVAVSLLDIYRAVRGLSFQLQIGEDNYTFDLVNLEQTDQDSEPFFTEGTLQWKMRKTYNEIIDLFQPLMDELKNFPQERQSDVERYWKRAVRDDHRDIAANHDQRSDVFKLMPAGKPT